MWTTIIIGLLFAYFFVAGFMFRDMISELPFHVGWEAFAGCFAISIFWAPLMAIAMGDDYVREIIKKRKGDLL